MKGLEKGRSQRYQTMAELAEDLRRYQDGEPLHARPPGPLRRVQKWGRRHPTASVGLGVALAAMFVISALLVQTVLAKSEAEQQSEIATQQRFNVLRLADLKILVDLEAQAAELWPAHPELTEDLADWVFSAEKLVAKLPQHEAFLEQLEDSSSSARDLSESELVWWKTTLADLVFDLRAIADPESGTLADVRQRLLRSESIEQETIGDYEEEWEETLFELSESEIYDQLVMEPQIGLVPLGPDPESGLWEFWHVDSGPQPQRDEDSGQLRMSAGAGIILVLLPGGTQPIGAQKEGPGEPHFDDWTESDEVPVHSVNLAPFFLSKFEMTQSQWQTVTGVNPSNWNGLSGVPGNPLVHPVEDVTWEECVATLRRVDLMLPTEAQWEYGARAETRTAWWTGERRQTLAGAANLADRKYAEWFSNVRRWDEWLDDGFAISAPVGSLRANDFGLHDVTGNVWEWCRDPYLDYQHPARDGDGLRSAEVVEPPLQYAYRGASFDSASILARVANRNKMSADGRNVDIGVRPCRAIDGQTGRSEE
jgi:formylglycine-generating enzyme required for sulfatase activity